MNETNEAAASNDGSGETSEADGSEGGSETAHVCKVIPGSTDGSEDGAHLDEPRRDLHRWRTPHRHLHHQQHQPP